MRDKYMCEICGYIYDSEKGDLESNISSSTKFTDLPDQWACPVCGASKSQFEEIE